jgi:RimJ/RimL family protein N-acetyltransferase
MPHVTLRPVCSEDLPAFFRYQQDPEANYMAAFTSEEPGDRQAIDAHWQRILHDDGIVTRTVLADGVVVGHVAQFEQFGEPEVSYWIDRRHWHHGIATKALKQLLREIPIRPLYARAAKDNGGSIRVLEKCGLHPRLRQRLCQRPRAGDGGMDFQVGLLTPVPGSALRARRSVLPEPARTRGPWPAIQYPRPSAPPRALSRSRTPGGDSFQSVGVVALVPRHPSAAMGAVLKPAPRHTSAKRRHLVKVFLSPCPNDAPWKGSPRHPLACPSQGRLIFPWRVSGGGGPAAAVVPE